jgi:hypothetical protein
MKEMRPGMRLFPRTILVIIVLTITLTGCVQQTANVANNIPANTATPAPQASPQIVKASASDADAMPVTLPVLDAFFAEESFSAELKSKLQLTDEQVERLRKVAREETSRLRETETGEYSGTTSAARAQATAQIKEILGEEKTEQLSEFLRQRWSGGTAEDAGQAHAASGKFNVVPADTRIVVNSPAFRMDVFENGKLSKSYKVGIGYPEFPLPTGMRKAGDIIFNPTWTPPDEPWVESANKVKPGQKIEAGDKLNPLGPIKIPIGLPSLIHGGKSPAKLGTFASHGCVGLTTPQIQDFTRLLARLSGTELTDEQIAGYAKNPKETKDVKLSHAIPVELRYETIVVEDGQLHIYRDVYDRNTNTEENLRAVLNSYGVTLEQLSDEERASVMSALAEMSRDASGKSDDANRNSNAEPVKGKETGKNANTKSQAESAKVTRTVKGRKEVVIEIAALKGKGYPAPVALDTGNGSKTTASTPAKGKRG